jgi:thiamine kinase-like enzyme
VVHALIAHDGADWLVREAFPQVLPMQRWFGDAAVLRALHQIHALSTDFAIPDPYLPTWEPLAEPYRAMLPGDLPEQIAALAAQHATVFAPSTVIVGDPTTPNWGVRADGTVVLFDWEYIGYGTPARDLGNLIPQFGWPPLYEQLAASYLALATPVPTAELIQQFAHDMALARLQSLIEYINGPQIAEDNRQYVLGLLPSWFAMIKDMDATFHAQFE